MNKLLLAVLLMSVTTANASESYPEHGRFVEYEVEGTVAYIIKDTKTGCEYITRSSYSSYTLVEGTCTNLPAGTSK